MLDGLRTEKMPHGADEGRDAPVLDPIPNRYDGERKPEQVQLVPFRNKEKPTRK